jgi:hypothetical protein
MVGMITCVVLEQPRPFAPIDESKGWRRGMGVNSQSRLCSPFPFLFEFRASVTTFWTFHPEMPLAMSVRDDHS